jgi:hypothetical protein
MRVTKRRQMCIGAACSLGGWLALACAQAATQSPEAFPRAGRRASHGPRGLLAAAEITSKHVVFPADTPTEGAANPIQLLIGTWQGVGVQFDLQSWRMNVVLRKTEGVGCAEVSYPGLACGGVWHCERSPDGKTLVAIERITWGREHCLDRGTVAMVASDSRGAAGWLWTDLDVWAVGLLERAQAVE